jgi:hypothetical protein
MMWTRSRALQKALTGWATVSVVISVLPPGFGGSARAVNAVVFLTFGPACAIASLLARAVHLALAAVIAIAASLTVLLFSSQILLILGLWAPWRVAALVALTTVGLTWVPTRTSTN